MSYGIKYRNYTAGSANAFDSLPDGATSSAATITHTSGQMFMDVQVSLAAQGVARSADALLLLQIAYFGTVISVANIDFDTSTSARDAVVWRIPAPPVDSFTMTIVNKTGQTTAASGNSFTVAFYDMAAT